MWHGSTMRRPIAEQRCKEADAEVVALQGGEQSDIAETLKLAGDERRRWTMAGARGLSHLTAPTQAVS